MKWISLGRKLAVDNKLHYDDVPKGALLWLKNHTQGKEERILHTKTGNKFGGRNGNKWLKYGIALVAGIPVALCLSVVCCSTSSLSSDILADDWRWMYACGVLSSAAFALLIFLFRHGLRNVFRLSFHGCLFYTEEWKPCGASVRWYMALPIPTIPSML